MSRRIVIPGVAAVLVGAAVAGWLWLRGEEPRPTTLHAELTSAFYAAIDTRGRDATPLTTEEVFPPATRSLAGMGQVSTRQLTDCDELLWGTSATGCTQALQATYAGGSMAGQFVIFNLADGRAADALVSALRKDGFVRQDVAFEPVGSLAQIRAMGHYVTVSWTGTTQPAQPGQAPAGAEPFDQLNEPIQSDQRDESGQPSETGRPEQPAQAGRPREPTDTGRPSDAGRGRSTGTEQLGGLAGTGRPGQPADSPQPSDPGPATQPTQPGQDLVAALIALDGLGRAVQGRVVAAT